MTALKKKEIVFPFRKLDTHCCFDIIKKKKYINIFKIIYYRRDDYIVVRTSKHAASSL